MLKKLLLLLLLLQRLAFAADWYVSPNAPAAGDGSQAAPWRLQTALDQPASVKAGDTIWLRGGEYLTTSGFTSRLSGLESNPITVRALPGEWAAITINQTVGNGLTITGAWTIYRDLEIRSTLSSRPPDAGGLGFYGHDNKLINTIVHDTGNNSPHGNGNLIYGCLFYFNGGDGSGLGHALYIQNEDPARPAVFEDNIIFASYAFGIHAYAGGVGLLNGLHFIGNVAFINGAAQTSGNFKDNYLIGGVNGQQGTVLKENMGWSYSADARSVALGRYSDTRNADITLLNNYFTGTTLFYNQWQSISMTGNSFYGPVTWEGNSMAAGWPDNSYLASAPLQNKIFVRPNKYEPGRAHIVVYNWESVSTAPVDVSAVLAPNALFEVRNAQNYFAPPLLTGTWQGGSLSLPLSGLPMATPRAGGLIEDAEKTGSRFNVFVLRQTGVSEQVQPVGTPTATRTSAVPPKCSLAVSRQCRRAVPARTRCAFVTALKVNGKALPGSAHELQRRTGPGQFKLLRRLSSGRRGTQTVSLPVKKTGRYRAVFSAPACVSRTITVRVRYSGPQ